MHKFALVTARVAPLGVAACLAAAGCGDSGHQQTVRPASNQGSTADQPGKGGGQAQSQGGDSNQSSSITQSGGGGNQSNSIIQQSGGGSGTSQSTSSGGGVQTLSGTGKTTVSFDVNEPSRFAWTNSEGKPFSATGGGISIDSRSGHGEIELAPRHYDNVEIRGSSWTIVVRPR